MGGSGFHIEVGERGTSRWEMLEFRESHEEWTRGWGARLGIGV